MKYVLCDYLLNPIASSELQDNVDGYYGARVFSVRVFLDFCTWDELKCFLMALIISNTKIRAKEQ